MLFRVVIGTSDNRRAAIFEDDDAEALLAYVMRENPASDGQKWVMTRPFDNAEFRGEIQNEVVWILFDQSLHENVEEAAEDENKTFLFAEPVTLGEWWDPDLD